jgi:hypothetical protein
VTADSVIDVTLRTVMASCGMWLEGAEARDGVPVRGPLLPAAGASARKTAPHLTHR